LKIRKFDENDKCFEKKIPKISFCFKLSEIHTLTKSYVFVVNKK
jgi:hypothetical protein